MKRSSHSSLGGRRGPASKPGPRTHTASSRTATQQPTRSFLPEVSRLVKQKHSIYGPEWLSNLFPVQWQKISVCPEQVDKFATSWNRFPTFGKGGCTEKKQCKSMQVPCCLRERVARCSRISNKSPEETEVCRSWM